MNTSPLHPIVREAPVVAIVRRPLVDPVRCVENLFEAGIRLVEITMDTPGATEILASMRYGIPSNALLGAGTVTDIARAEAALATGASFIVTPNLNFDVIRFARDHGLPIMPGAMTPTEIFNAAAAGADYVKVFPASALGPAYFRELRGPFAEIPLIATGGVNLKNAHEFIRFGADALGIGSSLIPKSNDDFNRCAEIAREFLKIAREASKTR